MYQLSASKQKLLETALNDFKRANLHPSNLEWRKETSDNFGFYDGSGQWRAEDVLRVRELKQVPLTVNVIQSPIDSLSGMEIQSRYRIAIRNSSGAQEKDKLANALTHWLFFIQKDQKIPYKDSLKFRDELVCGLGWTNIYIENGQFFYEWVHPFNVIPDFDDLSPQFENQKIVCRKRWMDPEMVRKIWPKVAQYIDFSNPDLCNTVYSPEITDRESAFTNTTNYTGYSQSRVLVGEVQRKYPKKAYYGIDHQGFYFETFNEEKAEQLANSPSDLNEFYTNY
jgi:hypothetical protein